MARRVRPALAGGRDGEAAAAAPYLVFALLCGLFAFVGLNAGGYWTDELFTLFLIDHHGGLGEVLRRALTDTHPPLYYFAAYGWLQAFGASETAMRAMSALLVDTALVVLFFGVRPYFSLTARAFGVALAAGSKLVFEQSQNIRNYSLALPLAAGLMVLALAIDRRWKDDRAVPPAMAAGFWAIGAAGSFTHFWLFLACGATHLYLLLAARRPAQRLAVIGSGLTILAPVGAYVVVLTRHSQQNLQQMWFSNAPAFLFKQAVNGLYQSWSGLGLGAMIVLALAFAWSRTQRGAARPPLPDLAPLGLAALVSVLTIAAGLAVSILMAPSFGKNNLMIFAPFLWLGAMWLYDAAAPDPRRARGRLLFAVVCLLVLSNGLMLRARLEPRQEAWRQSGQYVQAQRACRGAPMPVVLPYLFGPSTPFFRTLAQQSFFGRYDAQPGRLTAYTPDELAGRSPTAGLQALLHDRATGSGCAILAWGVHDLSPADAEALRGRIAANAGVADSAVRLRSFDTYKIGLFGTAHPRATGFVFERDAGRGPGTPKA